MNVQKLIEQCQTTTESENLKIERLRAQTEENRRRVAEEHRRTEEQATRRLEIQAVVDHCPEMLPELLRRLYK